MTTTESPEKPKVQPKKRPRHRDWGGALFILGIGTVGLFLGRLGHLWIGFDVFAQFGMQALLFTVAGLLALAVPKYKGLAAAVFTVMLIVAYGSWPHMVSRHGLTEVTASPGHKILRVASFNGYIYNDSIDEMEKSIKALNPDLMVIVEFGSSKLPLLDRLKADYPYQFTCQTEPPCETALISKFPISDFKAQVFWEGPPFISAKLGPEWNNLTVFGVHTTRFPHSRAQFTQARAFVKMAEGATGLKIVMGDFNSTSFSRINETFADGLDMARLTYLPSWPASYGFPQLAIDHIFASSDITAASGEVIGDNAGSDHYPISIALSVPVN